MKARLIRGLTEQESAELSRRAARRRISANQLLLEVIRRHLGGQAPEEEGRLDLARAIQFVTEHKPGLDPARFRDEVARLTGEVPADEEQEEEP